MRIQFFLGAMLVLFCSCNILHSQTEKGRLIYGGAMSFNTTNFYGVNFSLTPQFGGFPVKNLAIIGLVNLQASNLYLLCGVGPEFRYYVGGKRVKFFVFANAIPSGIYGKYLGQPFNYFGISTGGGPGIAVFPGSNFSIHASLFLGYQQIPSYPPGTFLFSFGTAFYGLFTPRKK